MKTSKSRSKVCPWVDKVAFPEAGLTVQSRLRPTRDDPRTVRVVLDDRAAAWYGNRNKWNDPYLEIEFKDVMVGICLLVSRLYTGGGVNLVGAADVQLAVAQAACDAWVRALESRDHKPTKVDRDPFKFKKKE